MKRLVLDERERCGQWARQRIAHVTSWEDDFQAIGYEQDGRLIAVCIAERWTGPDIALHIAAEPGSRWCTREFLGACFRYAFHQLGCRRVTGYVPASNTKARRLDEHLGFVYEGRLRGASLDGDDLLILGMLVNECRWLDTTSQRQTA